MSPVTDVEATTELVSTPMTLTVHSGNSGNNSTTTPDNRSSPSDTSTIAMVVVILLIVAIVIGKVFTVMAILRRGASGNKQHHSAAVPVNNELIFSDSLNNTGIYSYIHIYKTLLCMMKLMHIS